MTQYDDFADLIKSAADVAGTHGANSQRFKAMLPEIELAVVGLMNLSEEEEELEPDMPPHDYGDYPDDYPLRRHP